MTRCKPERNPAQVKMIFFVCIILLFAVVIVANTVKAYKWMFELLLIGLGTAAIAVVYRYSMSEMEYEVGNGDFNVYKKVGQKVSLVCSLDLSTAVTLIPKSEFTEKQASKEIPFVNVRYNFNQNIRCKSSYVYVCEFNGKTASVEFEPNEPFILIMLEEIEKSKLGKD